MTLYKFLDMFDIGNQVCRINDKNLNTIVQDEIMWIRECNDVGFARILRADVMAFGIDRFTEGYPAVLTIKVDVESEVGYIINKDLED